MIEIFGDVWDSPDGHIICIPSNGFVKNNGRCVMGRGVAQQARDRFEDLDLEFGRLINSIGNTVFWARASNPPIMSFPVKHHWQQPADPKLIVRSAEQLREVAQSNQGKTFVLPRPGCGNGQLKWVNVKPLIEGILPDNVSIIELH